MKKKLIIGVVVLAVLVGAGLGLGLFLGGGEFGAEEFLQEIGLGAVDDEADAALEERAVDVLNFHHALVDQDAHRQRESAEGHDVDGLAGQP